MAPSNALSRSSLTLALASLPFLLAEPSARADHLMGATSTGQQRGAGASPFQDKERALDELEDLRDDVADGKGDVGDRDHALEKLDHAIQELEESLDPDFWVLDDNGEIEGLHLDPDDGAHVFNDERHCAQFLFDAIDEGEIDDQDLRDELLAIVDSLVFIDRRLAQIQLDDAIGEGGDPEEIAEAEAELERGDRLVDRAFDTNNLDRQAGLLYEAMDNAYRHAWDAAIDATEEDGSAPLSAAPHVGGRSSRR